MLKTLGKTISCTLILSGALLGGCEPVAEEEYVDSGLATPTAIPTCTEDCDVATPTSPGSTDSDADGFTVEDGDTNDQDDSIFPGAAELADGKDNDLDGKVDEGTPSVDDDGDGYSEEEGDLDDADSSIYPGAIELEDEIDNDQDGTVDENTDGYDDDLDGFSESDGDMDDSDPSTYPGAPEIEDGRDNDQDSIVDEDYLDRDSDGYSLATGDMDDNNASIYPSAPETIDELDNDQDGFVDEGTTAYDDDLDGYSEEGGDCNDSLGHIYPGANEESGGKPDGLDNDCDGIVDEGTAVYDSDGDGFTPNSGDCDEEESNTYPGATEIADELDNDCDDIVDEDTKWSDDDADGFTEEEGDCDDSDDTLNPGATDRCNAVDDNCNGFVDESCAICLIPDNFATAQQAADAGCLQIGLNEDAPGDLTLIDPPQTVSIRPGDTAPTLDSLNIQLSAEGATRFIIIDGLSFNDASTVNNQHSSSGIVLFDLTFEALLSPSPPLSAEGYNIEISASQFVGNESTAQNHGSAGLSFQDATNFVVENVDFRNNTLSYATAQSASAILVQGKSSGLIQNSLFEGNSCQANEAAAVSLQVQGDDGVELLNNTFVRNSNTSNKGTTSLRCVGNAAPLDISSNIFWYEGDDATHVDCKHGAFAYNNTQNGLLSGVGNTSHDPQFEDPYLYTLNDASPSIDAGDPDSSRKDRDGSINDQGYTGGPSAN